MAQEAREDKAKQKVLEKELEWIRSGAKARQAKVQGPHPEIQRDGGPDRARARKRQPDHHPERRALGNKVIEVTGLKKHMGDKL